MEDQSRMISDTNFNPPCACSYHTHAPIHPVHTCMDTIHTHRQTHTHPHMLHTYTRAYIIYTHRQTHMHPHMLYTHTYIIYTHRQTHTHPQKDTHAPIHCTHMHGHRTHPTDKHIHTHTCCTHTCIHHIHPQTDTCTYCRRLLVHFPTARHFRPQITRCCIN